MSTSNVPRIKFAPEGIVLPAESEVLNGVLKDIDQAFGGGLNLNLETPQGQLASSEAAIISDKNSEIAYIVNQVDPQYSEGRFQDAIAKIYFLERKPAIPTVVTCELVGIHKTLVPAGAIAKDTSDNTYINLGDVIIAENGTANANFQNVKSGIIPCPANTLNQVTQAIIGWDAINNINDGVVGSEIESREDFEYRRFNSVSINGIGSVPAIYSNVFNVKNVLDCYVMDNPSGNSISVGSTNKVLLPHSLYVCVVGGLDYDVAEAIFKKKDVGCDYNGNTSVTVYDNSGYAYQPPAYIVKFERPGSISIKFQVNILSNSNIPQNSIQLIKNCIYQQFNGLNGNSRERIGSLIVASKYYGAISSIDSNISISSILIGINNADKNTLQIGIDQAPTLNINDIKVDFI